MKEASRSNFSGQRGLDKSMPPVLSQGHYQREEYFHSRLGPTMFDSSIELEESEQPRKSAGKRSDDMNLNKRTKEMKQVQKNTNFNNSNIGSTIDNKHNDHNNSNAIVRSMNKLQIKSNNATTNNRSKKSQIQNTKIQSTHVVNNNTRLGMNSSVNHLGRQKGNIRAQEEHDSRHAMAVAAASAAAAEAAAMAAQAAAEVMRLTGYSSTPRSQYLTPPAFIEDFSLDDFLVASSQAQKAATLIQAAYRGHLARQALRALKGLVKLQAVVRGHLVRRQARISLRCMQALVRLQARVRARQVKAALLIAQGQVPPPIPLHRDSQHVTSVGIPKLNVLLQNQQHSQEYKPPSLHHHVSPALHRDPAASHSLSHSPPISKMSPMHLHMSLFEEQIADLHSQQHSRPLDISFSRAESFISSEDSRNWDGSVLSKEEIEMKALRKQQAATMRQKALAYAENQRTPTNRSVGTPPSRRMSSDHMQQQRGVNRASFNDTEPEKLHRDWSWLEGWMAAHAGAASPHVWESNAAALWESIDEQRDRVGGMTSGIWAEEDDEAADHHGDSDVGHTRVLYRSRCYSDEEDGDEEKEDDSEAGAAAEDESGYGDKEGSIVRREKAQNSLGYLYHSSTASDDDPAVKIIEVDRAAASLAPVSSLPQFSSFSSSSSTPMLIASVDGNTRTGLEPTIQMQQLHRSSPWR
ncbi:hypothetical protein KP509_15G035700 [Ceratopteris richardii]|uniref:DUF4005 domain-containing protein n=1 Tax=Ceratopteris richardii TaxID=49495 RepID=A0A8T2T2D6_CERRI|nr:hypothetical protein KP509_15G035700 [Ceratopteris richardii]